MSGNNHDISGPVGFANPRGWGPATWLTVATIVCLLPFLDKAFHMDDPLFLWTARQILRHPLDFYGFSVNWYGATDSIAAIAKNPPGGAYWIALVAGVFGWSEWALHAGFILPAVGVVLGTYRLARELSPRPATAALWVLLTPVFWVSATQVMCDVPMLCLWVWAVWLWLSGERQNRVGRMAAAGVLIALCGLTKYFGVALVPLLLTYSLWRHKRPRMRMFWLLVPVLAFAFYQWATWRLYGRGLLLDAAEYASATRPVQGAWDISVRGLVYAGGCLVTLVPFALGMRPRGRWAWMAGLAMAGGGAMAAVMLPMPDAGPVSGDMVSWLPRIVAGICAATGLAWMALLVGAWRQEPSAETMLLLLWIAGTFVFAAIVNWSLNARSILPMAPACAVLLSRRLACGAVAPALGAETRARRWWSQGGRIAAWLAAALISFVVVCADVRMADSARSMANRLLASLRDGRRTVWFQGHWGFQYYMEAGGGRPFDCRLDNIRSGDVVILPRNNTNLFPLDEQGCVSAQVITDTPTRWIGTMNHGVWAGFYSDIWGPLPFGVGRTLPEEYAIVQMGTHATRGDAH